MKLTVNAREGNFNLLDFSDRSVSVHLGIVGNTEAGGERIEGRDYINLGLRCEDGQHLIGWRDNPLDFVAELTYLADKFRYIGDKEKFIKFRAIIEAHEDEIYQSWASEQVAHLTKQRDEIDKEINRLTKTLEKGGGDMQDN